jgi:hypothetical protein
MGPYRGLHAQIGASLLCFRLTIGVKSQDIGTKKQAPPLVRTTRQCASLRIPATQGACWSRVLAARFRLCPHQGRERVAERALSRRVRHQWVGLCKRRLRKWGRRCWRRQRASSDKRRYRLSLRQFVQPALNHGEEFFPLPDQVQSHVVGSPQNRTLPVLLRHCCRSLKSDPPVFYIPRSGWLDG